MSEVLDRTKMTRRSLLKGSVAAGAAFVIGGGFVAASDAAWAMEVKHLKPRTMATLIQMARDIYPHDHVADEFYAAAVKGYDSEESALAVEVGVAALDIAARGKGHPSYLGTGWERDRVDILRGMEQSEFFQTVRGGLVTGLYNNKGVWPLFGYEGESFSKGGYIDRGFDDINWIRGGSVMPAPFNLNDDSVVVVIGTGAGGGVLANELAQKGVSVVALEAGGRYLPEDYINDEWESFGQLAWLDARTTSGDWRVARDFSGLPAWIVKAVGGTTTHWAGASIRFQDHEWKAHTTYGPVQGANLLDWPIDGAEMAPWYEKAETKLGVTRTGGRAGLPGCNNYKVFEAGAKKLGYKEVHTGRMAINSDVYDDRNACQQTGFCFQGCKWGAKWSAAYTDIPRGEATGNLEVRERAHVLKIEHDDSGKVTGVLYADADGNQHLQKARLVAVAGNSIESPRLLLNSASNMFPDGLANSSGQVGRNYMRHMTGSVYAVFDKPVKMWRGTTMAGIIQDEARHDPSRGFVGGYEMETLALGLPFMAAFLDPGAWGREFTTALDSYENMAGMWLVGEDMPQETNRISLNHDVKDQYGLPAPNVHFDDHPNDIAMRNHAYKQGIAVYEAVGATRVFPTPPYPSTHNLGTNRMSENPRDGVVNKWGQTHDVSNLFISDGSQFTTGAAENPTLTIVALAIRQADHIAAEMSKGNL